jgi:hypothetical protein
MELMARDIVSTFDLPERICPCQRIILYICIEIISPLELNWVLAQESTCSLIVVSGAVEVETCFRVQLPPSVLERES